MNCEKLWYYSGFDLKIPTYPSKPDLSVDNLTDEEYLDKKNEYNILLSKYKQEMARYRDELDKRKRELLKELAEENNISYKKSKQLYNQCVINNSTNSIFEIHRCFQELVEIHKVLNKK